MQGRRLAVAIGAVALALGLAVGAVVGWHAERAGPDSGPVAADRGTGEARSAPESMEVPEPVSPSGEGRAAASGAGPGGGQVAALPKPPSGADLAGLPAWRRHAAPFAPVRGRPRIAVVIDDLGLDAARTERVIELPAPLTLAFLPYGPDLGARTARARARGHELLVHVSMEPEGGSADPGPHALGVGQGPEQIRARLDWALGRFAGYVGINNHMGSRFTSDPEGMAVVLGELKARGLLFLDSRTTAATVGYALARAAGIPAAERKVFLDRTPARDAVDAQLAEVERLARRDGAVIAIGHPHDATIEALAAWFPGLAEKGLQAAPVSAVVRHRSVRTAPAGKP